MSLKKVFSSLLVLSLSAAPVTSVLADADNTAAVVYPTTSNAQNAPAANVSDAEETTAAPTIIEDEAAAASPVQYPTEESSDSEEEYSFE